tara:strand:+ start:383 stop:1579 length:1197 start_codon:yes stop_codon:yes gene_type:complete
MKKVLYIIDNKFRDLWGFYDLKKNLIKKNYSLEFCSKFNWRLGIDYINPDIVILPNARKDNLAFQKIVNFAENKKIKIIIYPSESLDFGEEYLRNEFPKEIIEKVEKVLLWSDEQGQYLLKDGFKKKLKTVGTVRFQKINKNENKDKIKVIGITGSGRYLAPIVGRANVPRFIYTRQKNRRLVGAIKNEVEFLDFVSKIINKFSKSDIKIIFKPHPFENSEVYKDAFSNLDIEEHPDIRVFLSKIDVLVNQQSSANLSAIASETPVINVSNAIFLNKDYQEVDDSYLPTKIGITIKNENDLYNLINNHSVNELFKKNVEKGDVKLLKKLVPQLNTIELMTEEITNIKLEKTKSKNIINGILYYIKEIFLFYKEKNRIALFRPLKTSDQNLIKIFKINY